MLKLASTKKRNSSLRCKNSSYLRDRTKKVESKPNCKDDTMFSDVYVYDRYDCSDKLLKLVGRKGT